jgi:hypothetical protein
MALDLRHLLDAAAEEFFPGLYLITGPAAEWLRLLPGSKTWLLYQKNKNAGTHHVFLGKPFLGD